MKKDLMLLLFLAVVVVASGCISDNNAGLEERNEANISETPDVNSSNTKEVSASVCEAPLPEVDYSIDNQRISGVEDGYERDKIAFSGNIEVKDLPDGITEEEVLNRTEVRVKSVRHSGAFPLPYRQTKDYIEERESKKFENVCKAEIEGDNFDCQFEKDAGNYLMAVVSSYKGCSGEKGSIQRMNIVPTLESNRYEKDKISIEVKDVELDSVQDGWKNIYLKTYFENKGISTDEAPEGVSLRYKVITEDGEQADRNIAVSKVLEGYDDEREVGFTVREDQEVKYILYQSQYTGTVAFEVSELEASINN
mgnify:CR=1 FL=1